MAVPRSKLAFPQGMRTKLRYVQQVQFEPSNSTTIDLKAWRANSMTDPGITTANNHQPRGFDDFMDIYQAYTVLGSKISCNFMYKGYDGPAELDNDTSTFLIKTAQDQTNGAKAVALPPVVVGIRKGMVSAGAVAGSNIMEQERTKWRFMTGQQGSVLVSQSMRTSEFFGKGSLVGAEGYSGTKIADADNIIVYDVWCGRASNTTAGTVQVIGYIMIEYDVQFSEPKSLSQS